MAPRLLLLPACVLGIGSYPWRCRRRRSRFARPALAGGKSLATDDFDHGLGRWKTELEKGGTVMAQAGKLEIDFGGGTIWLKSPLEGAVLIEYEATVICAGA